MKENKGDEREIIRRLRIERIARTRVVREEIEDVNDVQPVKEEVKEELHSCQQQEHAMHVLLHPNRFQRIVEEVEEDQHREELRKNVAERAAWANIYKRHHEQ